MELREKGIKKCISIPKHLELEIIHFENIFFLLWQLYFQLYILFYMDISLQAINVNNVEIIK